MTGKTLNFLKNYSVLSLIIIVGTVNRLLGIISGNFGFTHDQGRDLLAADSILRGNATLIGPTTGLAGLFHGPLWYYLLAFLSFLGQGNSKIILEGIILLFLVFEIILFLMIKNYYGYLPAFLLLAIISLSPFYSGLNGQLWSPNMILVSSMIMAIAVVGIINGKKWYPLLGLSLGFNIQFEAAGGGFLLIATMLTLLLINPFKTKIKDYLVMLSTFFITLIPQLLFELKYGFLMTKHAVGYLGASREDFIAEHGIKTIEYKTGLIIDNFSKVFFDNVDSSLILFLVSFVLFSKLLFLKKGLDDKGLKLLTYCFSTIIIFWVVINFYFDVVWTHFIDGLVIFLILAFVVLLRNLSKHFKTTTYLFSSFLIFAMLIPQLRSINSNQNIVGDISYYKNRLEIIDDVYKDASPNDFNVVVYEPTTFSYQYDYLFMWYGNRRYGKIPVSNETPVRIAYYLIEPDNISGRREKWIKERDGEGVVLWEKTYWNTNFVLQKRIRENIQ